MAGILLAGPPGSNWRSFTREPKGSLIVLDPGSPEHGTPARVNLVQGDRVPVWTFVGSLEALKNPLGVLGGLARLLPLSGPDPLVQLFPLSPSPVLRQLAVHCAQLMEPDRILMPLGSPFYEWGWPVGPEDVSLEAPLPSVVHDAQRKARWIDLWDSGDLHEVDWAAVHTEGMRLGSGRPVTPLPPGAWAEVFGDLLLILAGPEWSDGETEKLMLQTGASRALLPRPADYEGLVCAFAEQDGNDFAMGVIQSVDLMRRRLMIRSKAVLESPIRILKTGTLRINRAGAEAGEAKLWSY